MKRLALTVLVALCLVGGVHRADAGDGRVLADHKGWISEPLDGSPEFGVNGTRGEGPARPSAAPQLDGGYPIRAHTTGISMTWPKELSKHASRRGKFSVM